MKPWSMYCHATKMMWNFFGMFDESLDTHPHNPEQLTRRLVVPRGNNAGLMTNER